MKCILTIGIVAVLGVAGVWGVFGIWPHMASRVWADSTQGEYFPLAIGNRWVYQASQGQATEEWKVIRQEKGAFVVKITADSLNTASFEELFMRTAAGVERVSAATGRQAEIKHPVVNSNYQAELAELAELAQSAQAPNVQEHVPLFFLKSLLRLGTVWENRDGRYEVTSLSETVTVPAGTFKNCAEIIHWGKSGGVTVITYYAPGVGVVQRDETFPLLEGSGNMNPRQKQQLVLQLKEWEVHSVAQSFRLPD